MVCGVPCACIRQTGAPACATTPASAAIKGQGRHVVDDVRPCRQRRPRHRRLAGVDRNRRASPPARSAAITGAVRAISSATGNLGRPGPGAFAADVENIGPAPPSAAPASAPPPGPETARHPKNCPASRSGCPSGAGRSIAKPGKAGARCRQAHPAPRPANRRPGRSARRAPALQHLDPVKPAPATGQAASAPCGRAASVIANGAIIDHGAWLGPIAAGWQAGRRQARSTGTRLPAGSETSP